MTPSRYLLPFLICCSFLNACSDTSNKVSEEQATAFSIVIENQVRDMKIDFLEKNILMPVFLDRINAAGDLKSSERMEAEMRKMLAANNYEKNVYELMAGSGSFKKVKQYQKEGNQRIIYRINGSSGFTYIEVELASEKEKVGIADIYLYNTGQNLSATVADLMKKLFSHEQSTIGDQLSARLSAISQHLKNTNYEFAKAEFDRLPYDIRNNRLYEIQYLNIMSKIGGPPYLEYQQKIETKYADDAGFQLMMIDVYLNQKKYDKAIASINQIDSVINKDPFLDYHRGLVSNMKADSEGAIKYFKQVIASEPTFPDPYPELVVCLAKKNDYPAAKQYLASYKKMRSANKEVVQFIETSYPGLNQNEDGDFR